MGGRIEGILGKEEEDGGFKLGMGCVIMKKEKFREKEKDLCVFDVFSGIGKAFDR